MKVWYNYYKIPNVYRRLVEAIYCKKCHDKKRSIHFDNAFDEIQSTLTDGELVEGCLSSCGYGKNKYFIEVDGELIMADTFDELLKAVKEL